MTSKHTHPVLDWQAADFQSWLETLPADQPCGEPWSNRECPLAQWRRAEGDPVAVTTYLAYQFFSETFAYLPLWATRFVFLVDRDGSRDGPIFPPRALTALDAALRDTPMRLVAEEE